MVFLGKLEIILLKMPIYNVLNIYKNILIVVNNAKIYKLFWIQFM